MGGNFTPEYAEDNTTFRFECNTMLMREGLPCGEQHSLIGAMGEIHQPYDEKTLYVYRKDEEIPRILDPCSDEVGPSDHAIDSFRRAIDDFADQIRDGTERVPSIDNSLHLMEMLLCTAAGGEYSRPNPGGILG